MALDRGLIDWVAEALAPLGIVTHRRMMGGAALYLDGVIFALVTRDGALWFKADAVSDAAWDAEGCERFRYARAGRTASINYRRAPEAVHDDAEAMRSWALLGVAAGRRAA
ncbi:TfoX/Sxy family protein [Sphingomonas sp. BK235]|uniref:TfoX/Sxy family protein n=1 Tax=Sphingomonas sp. BK235 TaxID=2512131 RepID=UPI00104C73CE|nr:TfoX/Sxy family protein [Sphingomonas sp. BK235]TCP34047.1 DNA transformation protein [Sphingomonas sp. BK235]